MMAYLWVFIAAFGIDAAYAVYIKAIADGRAIPATITSVIIGALGLYGVSSVVQDAKLAVPWLLGLGLSTYVIVTWENKTSKEKK